MAKINVQSKMVFCTVYKLEASENKIEAPFDKEEVSVCVSKCALKVMPGYL